MDDTQRIDKLEKFMLNQDSNGIAIMPLNKCAKFSIDDLGDEDGSNFSETLCQGTTLRETIDNLNMPWSAKEIEIAKYNADKQFNDTEWL